MVKNCHFDQKCISFILFSKWLEEVLLQYFVNWKDKSEAEGKALKLRADEWGKMFISRPTFVGIVMTGTCITNLSYTAYYLGCLLE